jgi:hypothetical protein
MGHFPVWRFLNRYRRICLPRGRPDADSAPQNRSPLDLFPGGASFVQNSLFLTASSFGSMVRRIEAFPIPAGRASHGRTVNAQVQNGLCSTTDGSAGDLTNGEIRHECA